jgi:16S rRNA processing protein RimM
VSDVDWDDMVLVGRVARRHGNRGEVIVDPETDFPAERFAVGRVFHVRREGRVETLTVGSVRFFRGRPIVGFAGVGSMTEAERLGRAELRIPPAQVASLPAGSYYHHDLVGCAVTTRQGRPVGVVRAVEGPMETSRLVIADAEGRETLVPLAAEICVEVDPRGRRIVIDPPEGLLDLNR